MDGIKLLLWAATGLSGTSMNEPAPKKIEHKPQTVLTTQNYQ